MMRKKAEDIEGVSNASMVDLKAVLYKREQDLKRHVPGDKSFTKRVKKRRRNEAGQDLFDGAPERKRNKGIDDRILRDQRLWEDEEITDEQRNSLLLEKARQYKAMMAKEFNEEDPLEDTNSLVDFERKKWDEDSNEEEDLDSLENLKFLTKYNDTKGKSSNIIHSKDALNIYKPGGDEYENARKSRVDAILQLSKETEANREKKASIKQRRLEEKQKRLEMIKNKAKKLHETSG